MICKARYRGYRPVLGAEKGSTYTVELTSCPQGEETPYLWVAVEELPGFLIPYEGMLALMTEWEFIAGEKDIYREHIELVDAWLDIYTPEEVCEQ